MKIKKGAKYKVITECHHFKNDLKATDEAFVLFPDEEYEIDFLFEKNGVGFIHLGTFKNEFGQEIERIVGFDIFMNCFEEII